MIPKKQHEERKKQYKAKFNNKYRRCMRFMLLIPKLSK